MKVAFLQCVSADHLQVILESCKRSISHTLYIICETRILKMHNMFISTDRSSNSEVFGCGSHLVNPVRVFSFPGILYPPNLHSGIRAWPMLSSYTGRLLGRLCSWAFFLGFSGGYRWVGLWLLGLGGGLRDGRHGLSKQTLRVSTRVEGVVVSRKSTLWEWIVNRSTVTC